MGPQRRSGLHIQGSLTCAGVSTAGEASELTVLGLEVGFIAAPVGVWPGTAPVGAWTQSTPPAPSMLDTDGSLAIQAKSKSEPGSSVEGTG